MVTTKEKIVLEEAIKKGYLTQNDFRVNFSPVYVKSIIEKFLLIGFMDQDVGDKFKINKKKIEEALK